MGSIYIRSGRRDEDYNANINTLTERIKKMRALNCNPSDIGMDGFIFRKWNSICTSRYCLKKL